MKIRVWSDIHLEFREYLYDHIWTPTGVPLGTVSEGADLDTTLLLAGDISVGTTARDFVTELCKHFKNVLLICGNHEYYYNDFNQVNNDWYEFEEHGPDNFYFLYNDSVVLDGVRFIGGTMWTSMKDGDPFVMGAVHRMMNDYNEIRCKGERITPHFTMREHDKFIDKLLKTIDKPFDGKTVVMSHHSPGNELKRRGRIRDALGSAYFADIEEMIGYHDKVDLWVHGHLHDSYDYMINNTRVVCNPYGYWGHATNRNFNDRILIEI